MQQQAVRKKICYSYKDKTKSNQKRSNQKPDHIAGYIWSRIAKMKITHLICPVIWGPKYAIIESLDTKLYFPKYINTNEWNKSPMSLDYIYIYIEMITILVEKKHLRCTYKKQKENHNLKHPRAQNRNRKRKKKKQRTAVKRKVIQSTRTRREGILTIKLSGKMMNRNWTGWIH